MKEGITVSVKQAAAVGDTIKVIYNYTYREKSDTLVSARWGEWPSDEVCQVISGPSRSSGQSYSFTHGTMSKSYTAGYHYKVRLLKAGKVRLPAMRASTAGGKELHSPALKLKVWKTKEEAEAATTANDILIVTLTPDKQHIRLGDSIQCELRLYTDQDVRNVLPDSLETANVVCRLQPPMRPQKVQWETTEYQGRQLRTLLLGRYTILPLQPGRLYIKPMNHRIAYQKRDHSLDLEELFHHPTGGHTFHQATVKSKVVKIWVEE
ncbi:MAG: BatD family protein [Bacteroides sp.]|nr:BatD family protein [Bacteroides sp.]